MAFGIKDVTKKNPCPLCGRDHWCAWMPSDYGKLLLCQSHNENGSFMGIDGCTYVYVGTSRSGTGIYEEESQYNRRIGDYKASNSGKRIVPAVQPKRLTIIDQVVPLNNSVLDRIYRRFLSFLVLEDRHREYLHKEGWTDEMIEKNHIVSLPIDDFRRYKRDDYHSKNMWRKSICQKMAAEFGSLKGVPGFYRKDGNWKIKSYSGIIFPMYDEEHRMYRLRVRMDFEDFIDYRNQEGLYVCESKKTFVEPLKGRYIFEDGKKVFEKTGGKYRNFSSFKEDEDELKDGFVKNVYEDGCQANNAAGCYYKNSDDFYCVYITEGEKKGILGNEILHAPFISLPGVTSFSLLCRSNLLDKFKELGTKVFIIAFDADKSSNAAVIKAEKRAIGILKEAGLFVGLAEWDASIGKGIDDILVKGHRPSFSVASE